LKKSGQAIWQTVMFFRNIRVRVFIGVFRSKRLSFLRQHKVDIVYFNAYLDNQIVINFWKKQGFKISKVIMTKDL